MHRNIISIVKPTRCTSISNLFYFGMTLHVLDSLSIHHQEFNIVRTATGICQILLSACQQADSSICLTAVCTVLKSWWWAERPSKTCRVSFQNKINLIHWCILLVLLLKKCIFFWLPQTISTVTLFYLFDHLVTYMHILCYILSDIMHNLLYLSRLTSFNRHFIYNV